MKVNIALLTVTDTRTFDNDKSGGILVNKINEADHNLVDRKICKDNKNEIIINHAPFYKRQECYAHSDRSKPNAIFVKLTLETELKALDDKFNKTNASGKKRDIGDLALKRSKVIEKIITTNE